MLTFIINHFTDFIMAITSIVTGASALTALTPSDKDDKVMSKIKGVLDVCALNVGNAKTA